MIWIRLVGGATSGSSDRLGTIYEGHWMYKGCYSTIRSTGGSWRTASSERMITVGCPLQRYAAYRAFLSNKCKNGEQRHMVVSVSSAV